MRTALLMQVVLEVIDENVAQGSRVYEEGHVRLIAVLAIGAFLCRKCLFSSREVTSRHMSQGIPARTAGLQPWHGEPGLSA